MKAHITERGSQTQTLAEAFYPLLQVFGTLFAAGLGLMLGSTVGSLVYPSPPAVGAILGGLLFMLIFTVIGCVATGFWKQALPHFEEHPLAYYANKQFNQKDDSKLDWLAWNLGVPGKTHVIVNVKEIQNVMVNSRLITRPELFVEISCRDNPTKATCTKLPAMISGNTVTFNEQFRIMLNRTTENINFVVRDQQVFGIDDVCFGYVGLEEMRKSFGQDLKVSLSGGQGYTLRAPGTSENPTLVLSFDPEPETIDAQLLSDPNGESTKDQSIFNRVFLGPWTSSSTQSPGRDPRAQPPKNQQQAGPDSTIYTHGNQGHHYGSMEYLTRMQFQQRSIIV